MHGNIITRIESDGFMAEKEKKTVLLRLTPRIWEEINRWAEDEFRSVNGQIEYLLQEAINRRNKGRKKRDEEDE